MQVNGQKVNCSFVLVSKVRNYGGDLEIAQSTSLLDDRFEVVLFKSASSFRFLNYLARVAMRKLSGVEGVSLLRATDVCMSGTQGRGSTYRLTASTRDTFRRAWSWCRTH